jgi:hypothetical protein
MDKNYDDVSLGLGIVGIAIAIFSLFVILLNLPILINTFVSLFSGANIIGIILGALSLKTSENRWKPILAIILGVISVLIAQISSFLMIGPLIQQMMDLFSYSY